MVELEWPRHPSAHGKDLYVFMCVNCIKIEGLHCLALGVTIQMMRTTPFQMMLYISSNIPGQYRETRKCLAKANFSNGAVNTESVTIESTTYETAQAKSGTVTASVGKEPQKMSTTCSAETSTEGGYYTQPELDTREGSHPQRGRVRLAAHHM